MHVEHVIAQGRENRCREIRADLAVIGGGLAGTCAALTAARAGLKVILAQDRPVLGGNASSEVRLWALGATSHMGNNNRWSREGGVVEELLLENLYRNREGNAVIFDTVLLDAVRREANIRLLLNTAAYAIEKHSDDSIASVRAFCSQNSTDYILSAPLYCDASGDGIAAYNAGAAFRIGSEAAGEFGEKLAAETANENKLGHTLFFYSKQAPNPVRYVPPSFAHRNIEAYPRFKNLSAEGDGCRLWWIEYGGNRDTVYDSEEIKWELWRIVYGAWDFIKNSGRYDDVDNLTLEWVGCIPGKRESRRFEGLYRLRQRDVVEQTEFADAVAHGGWAIDIHPAEGVYSDAPACVQWHSKGVYQIPYRCFVSRDIRNLFLAGRIISTTHVAFGSTRVMLTCALGGQAVGMAAAECIGGGLLPADLLEDQRMRRLQAHLNSSGQRIPGVPGMLHDDVLNGASVTASSELRLAQTRPGGSWRTLKAPIAQLLPLGAGRVPAIGVTVRARSPGRIRCVLMCSDKAHNFTPQIEIASASRPLAAGIHDIEFDFDGANKPAGYLFAIFSGSEDIQIMMSSDRITGIVSAFNSRHSRVSNKGKQVVPGDIGIDEFEFWTPERRPAGHNVHLRFQPALDEFGARNLLNGHTRPWIGSNAWVADPDDPRPTITIRWQDPRSIAGVRLHFDTDFDHALESVLMSHPEHRIPFCVRKCRIRRENGELLAAADDNYQSILDLRFAELEQTDCIVIELDHPGGATPASLFAVEVNPA